ncbi:MAG: DMT family transporter [Pyrinomonadaceae bacterium]
MLWLYLLLAALAGAFMPVQAGINSQLARWMSHPVQAAFVSFAVGTLALFAYCVALRQPVPSLGHLGATPWWVWTGGLLGAFFVTAATILVPRIGATMLLSASIAGQMGVSLLLDHYGLIGLPERPVSAWRVVGVVLVVAGVLVIRRF